VDLRELRVAVRRNWYVAVAVFVLCLIPGVMAGVLPEAKYTARATLRVDLNAGAQNAGGVQQATFAIPGIISTLQSRALKERAREDVPTEPVDYQSVFVKIRASNADSVISLSGESRSPAAAAAWVNAVAGRYIEEQSATGAVLVSVIDEADPPTQKSSPKPVPVLFGASLIGLIAGIFAAVGAARLRHSLDRGRTVRQRLGTTVLGEVPAIRGLRSERHDLLPWLASSPPSELVEAFQAIRTNVEFRLADLDARTIVVTSYQASAGKSTIATGLAWSLAAVGRPALLLDADLRRPTLHEKLGTNPGAGLADMVNVDPLSLVQPTFVPNLEFVPAGLPAGRPADVVSRALPRALQALDHPDRLVIIDSPPVEGVPETGVVVASGRYVLLVLDAKSVELPELGEAVFRLQDSGAVILGVVINRVSRRAFRRKTAYYGYQKAPNRAAARSRRSRQLQGTPMASLRLRRKNV